jgi:hypothetical protein
MPRRAPIDSKKRKDLPADAEAASPAPGAPGLDLARAFRPGTRFCDEHCTYVVKVVPFAPVTLPTGKVFAADPFTFHRVVPFERTVKRGTYPVTASVAVIRPLKKGRSQERVACVKITFARGEPATWVNATKRGQRLRELAPGERYGYGVDAGTGCFCDVTAAEALMKLDEIEVANEDFEGYLLGKIGDDILSAKQHGSRILVPETRANIVAFHSGWGDGFYGSYWGLSRKGAALCLVTDFGVYPRT